MTPATFEDKKKALSVLLESLGFDRMAGDILKPETDLDDLKKYARIILVESAKTPYMKARPRKLAGLRSALISLGLVHDA